MAGKDNNSFSFSNGEQRCSHVVRNEQRTAVPISGKEESLGASSRMTAFPVDHDTTTPSGPAAYTSSQEMPRAPEIASVTYACRNVSQGKSQLKQSHVPSPLLQKPQSNSALAPQPRIVIWCYQQELL